MLTTLCDLLTELILKEIIHLLPEILLMLNLPLKFFDCLLWYHFGWWGQSTWCLRFGWLNFFVIFQFLPQHRVIKQAILWFSPLSFIYEPLRLLKELAIVFLQIRVALSNLESFKCIEGFVADQWHLLLAVHLHRVIPLILELLLKRRYLLLQLGNYIVLLFNAV